jgi:hypothetical protein
MLADLPLFVKSVFMKKPLPNTFSWESSQPHVQRNLWQQEHWQTQAHNAAGTLKNSSSLLNRVKRSRFHMFFIVEQPLTPWASSLLFGRKDQLKIDLGDISAERENLHKFLGSKLKVEPTIIQGKIVFESNSVSPQEVQRLVTKFIYARNLNTRHWASLDGSTIRIQNFKGIEKKVEKHKKSAPAETPTQSWGL